MIRYEIYRLGAFGWGILVGLAGFFLVHILADSDAEEPALALLAFALILALASLTFGSSVGFGQ